eukprot:s386_g45.t1
MQLNREPIHSAVYTTYSLNAHQVFNLLPFTVQTSSFQVRRGTVIFRDTNRQPINNGDNLIVVLLPNADGGTVVPESDLSSTLQLPFAVSHSDELPTIADAPSTHLFESSNCRLDQPREDSTLRLTDAFHNVPSRWFGQNDLPPDQPPDDPDDADHFLHEAPDSVQHLFDSLQAEGVVEGARVTDSVLLRSWFIHHQHSTQGFQYRVIELNGHWRFWYNDVVQAWQDHIRPLEQVIFDVVRPDPPRTASMHEFIFDIIVSQGIDSPRRAGLVTVLQRDDRAARAAYAVAVSLPDFTSGHQIVQYADALTECSRYCCAIRHGRMPIPFDTAPTHVMQDGDSFVISVSSQTPGGASSSRVAATSSGAVAPEVLCPWFRHLDLPDFVRSGIDACVQEEGVIYDVNSFDRLVVYTDGSSKPSHRRQPPLRVAEQGTPDAWAYVVLGEIYPTAHSPGSLTFLGWQAQQIMYEEDYGSFLGTDQIGAEYAEREAMIFAGLWRFSLNSSIPTIFRTDSTTTADQAVGRSGFACAHPTHAILRGTFQALQSGLPPEDLLVEHVRGHTGDVWNELADFLAKTEAVHGHHLQRQKLNLPLLKPCIPHLWMIVEQNAGLPSLTMHGFDVAPPALPAAVLPTSSSKPAGSRQRSTVFSLSLASFNVGSLFLGPDGFSGKLSYIRQQAVAHGFNVIGLQEARSPPGLSLVDDVLRISSGADQGCFGVELWVVMCQPYAFIDRKPQFFARSHFQLLHHDPRRLLARVATPYLDGFFLVLHAPQSGRSLQERQTWWDDTVNLVDHHCHDFPLYVMMDANAKTGTRQEPIVFDFEDTASSSTQFLRAFLEHRDLCLPSTTEIHQGPHHTWMSPDGNSTHRIDYVAIPQTFLSHCTWSSTVSSLEPGHIHNDHTAVALQMEWHSTCLVSLPRPAIVRHDRAKISDARSMIASQNFQVLNWSCDIESHVLALNSSIHEALHQACPFHTRSPKKQYIDEATWSLRTEKLRLRTRLQQSRLSTRRDFLALIFYQWKGTRSIEQVDEAWNHRTTILCADLHLACQYWKISRQLKFSLKNARNKCLNQAIQEVGPEAAAGTLLHTLRSFIGPTNPKKQKRACLPIVKKADGTLCATPGEAEDRWIEYFQAMEGGSRVNLSAYRQQWLDGLAQFRNHDTLDLSLQALPSLAELEQAYRRVSVGKAIGCDAIPPEVCHFCPVQMARSSYTVMLKAALFGQEAIEHKGGKLAVAWKQKGDVRECKAHRSLLVSSHLGKTVHRALRQKYNGIYNAYMQRQQLGGRPHMPVGIPLHMTRAFLRWKHRCKQPAALVFLDLTEAFYRTLRPLAVGGDMSDHCIAQMCQRLRLSPDDMHELHSLLAQPSALQEALAPVHVQRMLQAFHRDTWFQLGSQTDLVRTEIGSRPGDSFADIVFGYLWAKILKSLEATLVQHHVLESVVDVELPDPYQYHSSADTACVPLLGPTWMDDLNIVLTASSNPALVSKAQFTLSVLIDACRRHQMEPNLQKGKTEVMFTFCGPHARDYRRRYYSESPGLPVVCDHATYHVEVVSRYLHLGGIIHHRDVNQQEISRRFAIANQAYQQHRRLLYRNRHISWKVRCDLFQTLILSKLMYGFESWAFATVQSRNRIHAGVMKLYRKLLGAAASAHLTDLDVLTQTGLPSPTELLRRARLRYFGTLHNCKRHAHWGLLQEDVEWVELLRDDLHWLWCQLQASTDLQDPQLHFPQWQDLIMHHYGYWKKLIKKGIWHACLQRQKEASALELHSRIGALLLKEGFVDRLPCHVTSAFHPEQSSVFGCMCCQMTFASFAGERVHMCRSHGQLARERFLFDGTHCPCCLREFHTYSKVLAHLSRATRCKESLLGQRMNCSPAPGVGSSCDNAKHARTDGALPFQQALGPSLPPVPRVQMLQYDLVFSESLYECLLAVSRDDSIIDALRRFIQAYPISWTACCRTLHYLQEQLTLDDLEPIAFSFEEVSQCLITLAQPDAWPFLADASRGDIEWFLDSMSSKCSGFIILTVSIDIIIDSEYGDISKSEVRSLWLHYICAGHVAGFIAGPPCNTWSRARSVQLTDRLGPRVIRTPDEPWGLSALRIGELQQITIGTILLGFALECLLALAMHSGCGLVEHPRASDDDDAVSIWKLPVVHLIMQFKDVRLIHLAQGLFGAPSPKPTSLLTLRLFGLEKCLHQGMLTKDLLYQASTGRDASGHFRTAPLKEYPPGFCRSIASSFIEEFQSTDASVEHGITPPDVRALQRANAARKVCLGESLGGAASTATEWRFAAEKRDVTKVLKAGTDGLDAMASRKIWRRAGSVGDRLDKGALSRWRHCSHCWFAMVPSP